MEPVEDVQGLRAFFTDDFEMASSPFEAEWRGAHYEEETGWVPVIAGARPVLPRDNKVPSERVEPGHQLHLSLPAGRLGGSRSPVHFFQSLAFRFDIGSRVDIGRVEAFMSKPTANHRHINLCRDKAYSRGVPEPVWGYSLANQ